MKPLRFHSRSNNTGGSGGPDGIPIGECIVTSRALNGNKPPERPHVLYHETPWRMTKSIMKRTLRRNEWFRDPDDPDGPRLPPPANFPQRWRNDAAALQYLMLTSMLPVPEHQQTFEDMGSVYHLVQRFRHARKMVDLTPEQKKIIIPQVRAIVDEYRAWKICRPGLPRSSYLVPPARVTAGGWKVNSVWRPRRDANCKYRPKQQQQQRDDDETTEEEEKVEQVPGQEEQQGQGQEEQQGQGQGQDEQQGQGQDEQQEQEPAQEQDQNQNQKAPQDKKAVARGDFYFAHNDLTQDKILVSEKLLRVVAITGWDCAGFWPEWFEKPLWELDDPKDAEKGDPEEIERCRAWLCDYCDEVVMEHLPEPDWRADY